jgi:hypothetical protein
LAIVLLAAAAVGHLWYLAEGNRRLEAKIRANEADAEAIESAQARWQVLSPAIDPRRSPVELFHQVASLLPEKGLRLTAFEVRDDKVIEVRAEGATMANALQIKGALEKGETLSDYTWVIPPPRPKEDLHEFFATGTYRFAPESNETE